jgi:GNAT superfamily N-acetyltransferase
MLIDDVITIKTPDKNGEAMKFIRAMYNKFPRNPLNNREFCIVYGTGDDMQAAFFELGLSHRGNDWVEIKFIHTVPHRAGVGTRAMADIQKLAKEYGIKLTLFAWDKGTIPQSKLRNFYTKAGFEQPKRNTFTWEPK